MRNLCESYVRQLSASKFALSHGPVFSDLTSSENCEFPACPPISVPNGSRPISGKANWDHPGPRRATTHEGKLCLFYHFPHRSQPFIEAPFDIHDKNNPIANECTQKFTRVPCTHFIPRTLFDDSAACISRRASRAALAFSNERTGQENTSSGLGIGTPTQSDEQRRGYGKQYVVIRAWGIACGRTASTWMPKLKEHKHDEHEDWDHCFNSGFVWEAKLIKLSGCYFEGPKRSEAHPVPMNDRHFLGSNFESNRLKIAKLYDWHEKLIRNLSLNHGASHDASVWIQTVSEDSTGSGFTFLKCCPKELINFVENALVLTLPSWALRRCQPWLSGRRRTWTIRWSGGGQTRCSARC